MQEIQTLNDKLDMLLKKHTTLLAENKTLRKSNDKQQQTINTLNQKISTLEESVLSLQINNSLQGDKEKNTVRKQLDTVIGEIDKILMTLND